MRVWQERETKGSTREVNHDGVRIRFEYVTEMIEGYWCLWSGSRDKVYLTCLIPKYDKLLLLVKFGFGRKTELKDVKP